MESTDNLEILGVIYDEFYYALVNEHLDRMRDVMSVLDKVSLPLWLKGQIVTSISTYYNRKINDFVSSSLHPYKALHNGNEVILRVKG